MNSFHRLGGELLPPPRAVPLPRGGRSLGRENRELAEYRRARIARPFVPDVITTTFQEGARRVIGATAKPLYPIDGKASGLDRRNPRPPSSREGDRPKGGGRSRQAVEGVPAGRRSSPFFEHEDCKKTVDLLYCNVRNGLPSAVPAPHPSSERTWQREKAHPLIFGHPRRIRPDFR